MKKTIAILLMMNIHPLLIFQVRVLQKQNLQLEINKNECALTLNKIKNKDPYLMAIWSSFVQSFGVNLGTLFCPVLQFHFYLRNKLKPQSRYYYSNNKTEEQCFITL